MLPLKLKMFGFKAFSAVWIAFSLAWLVLCILGFGAGVIILSMQGKGFKAAVLLIVGCGFLSFGISLLRRGLREIKVRLVQIKRAGK